MPERTESILKRRFGFKNNKKEALEFIGQDYQITRERVRQIEEDGLRIVKEKAKLKLEKPFQYFSGYFKKNGNLKKEEILLNELGGPKFQPQVSFLLTLGERFEKVKETKSFYSFWTINPNSLTQAQKVTANFLAELKRKNQPLFLPLNVLPSYLEISKEIMKGPEGLYGLVDWPGINPRGIKDWAYLALRKEKKPLHFGEITSAININKRAFPQTVHNELIRDPRFVLVGRGIYALKEWGYEPGIVKEVISRILKEGKKPMPKEEIIKRVLGQRQVKTNTVLLNLQNKKYFLKNSQGKYIIREL